MRHFDNLVKATATLRDEGYTYDFRLLTDQLLCEELNKKYTPKSFHVDELHHFEGDDSSADTRSTLFAISTDTGEKGILIDEDGMYGADNVSEELLAKLRARK
jgi:hypothetical protein